MLRQIFDEPEAADALQARATALRKAIEAYPLIPAIKSVLAQLGNEPAWRMTRAPHEPLPLAKSGELAGKLAGLGFRLGVPAAA